MRIRLLEEMYEIWIKEKILRTLNDLNLSVVNKDKNSQET